MEYRQAPEADGLPPMLNVTDFLKKEVLTIRTRRHSFNGMQIGPFAMEITLKTNLVYRKKKLSSVGKRKTLYSIWI